MRNDSIPNSKFQIQNCDGGALSTVTVMSVGARSSVSWPKARIVYVPGFVNVAFTSTLPSTTFT